MEDDIDIYGDLSPRAIREEIVVSEPYNDELAEKCVTLENEVATLRAQVQSLTTHFSSLLKTAKAEITRKDNRISELRKELDNAAFRRGPYRRHHNPHNQKSQRESSRVPTHVPPPPPLNFPPDFSVPPPGHEYLYQQSSHGEMYPTNNPPQHTYTESSHPVPYPIKDRFSDSDDEEPQPKHNPSKTMSTVYGERLLRRLQKQIEDERIAQQDLNKVQAEQQEDTKQKSKPEVTKKIEDPRLKIKVESIEQEDIKQKLRHEEMKKTEDMKLKVNTESIEEEKMKQKLKEDFRKPAEEEEEEEGLIREEEEKSSSDDEENCIYCMAERNERPPEVPISISSEEYAARLKLCATDREVAYSHDRQKDQESNCPKCQNVDENDVPHDPRRRNCEDNVPKKNEVLQTDPKEVPPDDKENVCKSSPEVNENLKSPPEEERIETKNPSEVQSDSKDVLSIFVKKNIVITPEKGTVGKRNSTEQVQPDNKDTLPNLGMKTRKLRPENQNPNEQVQRDNKDTLLNLGIKSRKLSPENQNPNEPVQRDNKDTLPNLGMKTRKLSPENQNPNEQVQRDNKDTLPNLGIKSRRFSPENQNRQIRSPDRKVRPDKNYPRKMRNKTPPEVDRKMRNKTPPEVDRNPRITPEKQLGRRYSPDRRIQPDLRDHLRNLRKRSPEPRRNRRFSPEPVRKNSPDDFHPNDRDNFHNRPRSPEPTKNRRFTPEMQANRKNSSEDRDSPHDFRRFSPDRYNNRRYSPDRRYEDDHPREKNNFHSSSHDSNYRKRKFSGLGQYHDNRDHFRKNSNYNREKGNFQNNWHANKRWNQNSDHDKDWKNNKYRSRSRSPNYRREPWKDRENERYTPDFDKNHDYKENDRIRNTKRNYKTLDKRGLDDCSVAKRRKTSDDEAWTRSDKNNRYRNYDDIKNIRSPEDWSSASKDKMEEGEVEDDEIQNPEEKLRKLEEELRRLDKMYGKITGSTVEKTGGEKFTEAELKTVLESSFVVEQESPRKRKKVPKEKHKKSDLKTSRSTSRSQSRESSLNNEEQNVKEKSRNKDGEKKKLDEVGSKNVSKDKEGGEKLVKENVKDECKVKSKPRENIRIEPLVEIKKPDEKKGHKLKEVSGKSVKDDVKDTHESKPKSKSNETDRIEPLAEIKKSDEKNEKKQKEISGKEVKDNVKDIDESKLKSKTIENDRIEPLAETKKSDEKKGHKPKEVSGKLAKDDMKDIDESKPKSKSNENDPIKPLPEIKKPDEKKVKKPKEISEVVKDDVKDNDDYKTKIKTNENDLIEPLVEIKSDEKKVKKPKEVSGNAVKDDVKDNIDSKLPCSNNENKRDEPLVEPKECDDKTIKKPESSTNKDIQKSKPKKQTDDTNVVSETKRTAKISPKKANPTVMLDTLQVTIPVPDRKESCDQETVKSKPSHLTDEKSHLHLEKKSKADKEIKSIKSKTVTDENANPESPKRVENAKSRSKQVVSKKKTDENENMTLRSDSKDSVTTETADSKQTIKEKTGDSLPVPKSVDVNDLQISPASPEIKPLDTVLKPFDKKKSPTEKHKQKEEKNTHQSPEVKEINSLQTEVPDQLITSQSASKNQNPIESDKNKPVSPTKILEHKMHKLFDLEQSNDSIGKHIIPCINPELKSTNPVAKQPEVEPQVTPMEVIIPPLTNTENKPESHIKPEIPQVTPSTSTTNTQNPIPNDIKPGPKEVKLLNQVQNRPEDQQRPANGLPDGAVSSSQPNDFSLASGFRRKCKVVVSVGKVDPKKERKLKRVKVQSLIDRNSEGKIKTIPEESVLEKHKRTVKECLVKLVKSTEVESAVPGGDKLKNEDAGKGRKKDPPKKATKVPDKKPSIPFRRRRPIRLTDSSIMVATVSNDEDSN